MPAGSPRPSAPVAAPSEAVALLALLASRAWSTIDRYSDGKHVDPWPALMSVRGRLDSKMVNHVQKLNEAFKVVRHLTQGETDSLL